MYTNYDMSAMRAHELNIQMRTSSGDVITMDFENSKAMSLQTGKSGEGASAAFSFASLQQFQFSIESNGIDAQDQKEIDAFMEIARPYIENFMQELSDDAQKRPLNQITQALERSMKALKSMPEPAQNHAKNGLVKMFDDSLKLFENTEKLLDESQKLLESIIEGFDITKSMPIYA